MAEKTNSRNRNKAVGGKPAADPEVEKARSAFFRRSSQRPRNAPAAPKREPQKPSGRASAMPSSGAAVRGPDIAQRSAGAGHSFVEAMAAIPKERAYENWAKLDLEELRAMPDDDSRANALRHMAANVRDPGYAEALRGLDPELAKSVLDSASAPAGEHGRIEASAPEQAPEPVDESVASVPSTGSPAANDPVARDPARPETAANEPRVALADRVVANDAQLRPDVEIDQTTRDRLAAQRARDTAAARGTLAESSRSATAPVPPVRTPAAGVVNSIGSSVAREAGTPDQRAREQSPAVSVTTNEGYEIPAAIASRYVVKDGKYWQFDGRDKTPDLTGEPHFEDRGARLSTPSDDRSTIADMIAIAQAKGWKEVGLAGSDEFRRNAWIEASLAGIEAKGFKPEERDQALLEAARRERETLNISAGTREQQRAMPSPNEVVAREPERPAPAPVPPATEKSVASGASVKELREQAERAVARLPENVRREVMDRFAERVDAGMKAERAHERAGGTREQLAPVLDKRLAQVDQARVARQAPPAAPETKAPGRNRDRGGPDLSR